MLLLLLCFYYFIYFLNKISYQKDSCPVKMKTYFTMCNTVHTVGGYSIEHMFKAEDGMPSVVLNICSLVVNRQTLFDISHTIKKVMNI